MRIIDKNNDFYDYLQGVYPDRTITFDRTDSYLLTREIICDHLRRCYDYEDRNRFLLLQVCNTFWLFLVEITKVSDFGSPKDYTLKLLHTWKNYDKCRKLISLDVLYFDWHIVCQLIARFSYNQYDIQKIVAKTSLLVQAIDTNDFEIGRSIKKATIVNGDGKRIEKHIPILKACGMASLINPLDIYLAFEEYFSLEKQANERTESTGITDKEKAENHGFDTKTSFRGKSGIIESINRHNQDVRSRSCRSLQSS